MLNFTFTTLTPLHISNGEELGKNIDYLISNGRFLRLDHVKLASFLAKEKAFDFKKQYDLQNIERVIKRFATAIYDTECSYIIDIDNKVIEYLNNPRAEGKHFVKEFINSNGNFYIPASSVKGVLLTVLVIKSLGIDSQNGSINQKVVFHDSDFISPDSFTILKTEPGRPSVNVMCLKSKSSFSMKMKKIGMLNVELLKSKLSQYSLLQIGKAKEKVKLYKSRIINRPNGADNFLNALENITEERLSDKEYLVNLGAGAGSWFKIFENVTPQKFKNRKTREDEFAHTAFTVSSRNGFSQLGWCKLKIEEF